MKKFIISAVATAAALSAISLMCDGLYMFNLTMSRKAQVPSHKKNGKNKEVPPQNECNEYMDFADKGKEYLKTKYTEKVQIISEDRKKLSATIVLSNAVHTDGKLKFTVCIHGYRSNGLNDFAMMAEYFTDAGFGMLIPDNRSHGESEGKYIGFGWNDRKDCLSWCEYLVKRYGEDIEIVLMGISMGATAVMAALGENTIPQIKCAVEDCGYSNAWEELSLQLYNTYGLKPFPALYLVSIWNKIINGYFISENNALKQIKNSKLPILFIHGENDRYVPLYMVNKLYEAYEGPKMLYIAPNAAHAQSFIKNQENYKKKLDEFFSSAFSEHKDDVAL
ncbi:hypothetical protein SDC9_80576 [bioreactor metagenome]|uniref:Peptidase S9 prolyl oligopeptidase catalytic domain-containing protein n=1 Tax=bioreactor metagenome TaxID=1076179 RepID=A0A644YZD8_9ZZZZ|nr:alpha/beta hydrolase [Oscillospiraceae bacterium]